MNAILIAKALGLFSVGLGLVELAVPHRVTRNLGLDVSPNLVRLFGAREIGAGLAVLTYPDNPAPVWARVAGDVLDVAVLGTALGRSNRHRNMAVGATVAVLAITALDVVCAAALQQRSGRALRTAQRTRVRRTAARGLPIAQSGQTG